MKSLRPIFLLFLISSSVKAQSLVSDSIFTGLGIIRDNQGYVICIRKITSGERTFYLYVNPSTLKTGIAKSDSIFAMQADREYLYFIFRHSPYIEALSKASSEGYRIQDAGLTSFGRAGNGITLTVDLCPSRLPLERVVFTDIAREMGRRGRPVPVAVCITGQWMESHPSDLAWLDSLDRSGELEITWVNHSFDHFYKKDLPLSENFMLAPGTDVLYEVTENEKSMFERHMTPSVFFRFPGLVSDNDIYSKIISFGLIPVGSDAWLAKGERPGRGSIVLIHGNGNEPLGVKEFINLLQKEEPEIISGKWELFDLREITAESNAAFN